MGTREMKSFLVGGYVRDKLLGFTPVDRDWVVVGETPQSMLSQGYQLVGKNFPVFLHPVTNESYALARTDRNQAVNVNGRPVFTDSNVTLEEDLARRDLTINAMAMTDSEKLIDPFNGLDDLENKILRHVGDSFREDPIRVLRIARFAARYQFEIASETKKLIGSMCSDGCFTNLVPERVWAELNKALSEDHPDVFIEQLRDLGALEKIFPELDCLFGIPQTEKHHPEIDTGTHLLLAMKIAAEISPNPMVRFGTLMHDLGKCATDKSILPRHIGHEKAGVAIVDHFSKKHGVPSKFQQFGHICSEYHPYMHQAFDLKPSTLVRLFEKIGAFHQPTLLQYFFLVCEADARGRKGFESIDYPQSDYMSSVFDVVSKVSISELDISRLEGKEIGEALTRLRVSAAKRAKNNYQR